MLNQILEFHAVVQTQLGRLAALKGFLDSQEEELSSDNPHHVDVDSYIDIVQATLHVRIRPRDGHGSGNYERAARSDRVLWCLAALLRA